MVTILPYDPRVKAIYWTSMPDRVVAKVCANNMKGKFASEDNTASTGLTKYLYFAGHHSPLEFTNITFDITNISRACGDQLMRHRRGVFSSSSTHYQNYSGYPCRISQSLYKSLTSDAALNEAFIQYELAIEDGIPHEEARQLLPLAAEIRLIWNVNARWLADILIKRTCYRNTLEMVLLAEKLLKCSKLWWPALFEVIDDSLCRGEGLCDQGKLSCKRTKIEEISRYYWIKKQLGQHNEKDK